VVLVAMVAMERESGGGDGASERPCYRCGTGVGPVWDRWHVHGQCKGWMWWQNMGVVAVVNDVCGGQ